MASTDVQKIYDRINEANDRVKRITEARRAAQEDYEDVRDRHARAALLAEFDETKKREKADLEKLVSKAHGRIRELEQALPVAQDEARKAEEELRRATAHDAMKRAEASIRDREKAMQEVARLLEKLGQEIDRAEQAGLDARRHAMQFSLKERDSMASSAVEPGTVRTCVEALMWQNGFKWLTDRTTLADSDDVLERLKFGHQKTVERWRQQLPDQERA